MLFDAMPLSEEGEKSDLPGVGLGLTWLAVVLFFPCYFLKIKGGGSGVAFCLFFCFVSFFPLLLRKRKKERTRECVCERERERKKKSPRKVSFCLYPRIWIPSPTGMSSHKFSTEAYAECIIRWREGAFGSQGGGARWAARAEPGPASAPRGMNE